MLRRFAEFAGSLRLTTALLFLSSVLVFFGTLDQVRYGIHAAQQIYFEGLLAFWQYPEQWPAGKFLGWVVLPIPGGYLLGPLLLVNLVCAHFIYFRPRWSRAGIVAIHAGIALLLIGQLVSNFVQEDHFMWLDEGETGNYLQSFRLDEIAVTDITETGRQRVVTFPAHRLQPGRTMRHEALPFAVSIRTFHRNASLEPRESVDAPQAATVTRGIGAASPFAIIPRAPVTGTKERDMATAVVELETPEGSLGSWLLCNAFEDQFPPQSFAYDGRRYRIDLRFARTPLPFSLTLLDFIHERYPGTEIPKHFASRVRLLNPSSGEDRELSIYMNHPLRYGGFTFYQASFARGDQASMFQVVRNPGRLLPYIASWLVSAGLLFQFTYRLWRFKWKKE